MVMTRVEKDQQIEEIQAIFEAANSCYLVDLAGLSSNEINDLRAALREKGARMRVVKNRLARRASAETPIADIAEMFQGPTAVVYHDDEPVATAKSLIDFAKDHPNLGIKGGVIDRSSKVDGGGVKTVSELPGPDEMRAMLLAMVNAPAVRLARLLNTPGTQLATIIERHSEAEGGGEAA